MSHDWLQHYPSHIPHTINIGSLKPSIAARLEETCSRFADAKAITCMGTDISFGQLDRLADRFASYCINVLKLKKGDRIAIMLPNLIQFPIAFYGAQKAGLICVNTNPLYTPREMLHQFADSGATTVVILDLFLDKLEEIIKSTQIKNVITTSISDQLPALKSILIKTLLKVKRAVPKHGLTATINFNKTLAIGAQHAYTKPPITHNDIAILQYTGGTTGVAKAAMLTQLNVLSNMEQIKFWAADLINSSPEKNVLTALPLYHIFALSVNFLSFIALGARMILIPKPVPIKNTIKMFRKYKICALTGVNTLFNAINNDPSFKALAPRDIKVALAGGMALQQNVSKAWQRVTGIPITEGFGLTEASPVTHCNVLFRENPVGSMGLPLPSTIAKIVNEDGEDLPHGEAGELLIKGPQVMKGYWQKPDETANTIKDGWLWTGDIAKRDQNGFFYIVDRKKDMILVSGFNVYPNEVEDVLSLHPKVLEAAVVGIDDEQSGEAVKAFIVKKDESLTEQELMQHCSTQLTNYKRPKRYEFRKELPKTNVGKILRKELREKK